MPRRFGVKTPLRVDPLKGISFEQVFVMTTIFLRKIHDFRDLFRTINPWPIRNRRLCSINPLGVCFVRLVLKPHS